jgi:RNA-directed DNA polymerase
MCPDFRDAVVQHAIFNFLEQIYDKGLIYDSYACRGGKGTHKAFLRLKSFLNKYSEDDYFVKCDITKYFYSINHEKLKEIIRRKIKDENLLWLIYLIIDSHNEESFSTKSDCGIPIGNLMSQLFANIYLNELDYFVKHDLKIKHYIRYVDDFVILGNKRDLKKNIEKIRDFLKGELFLKLEDRKIQMNKVSFGVDFTGYVAFKKYVRIRSRNYRRFVRKFKVKSSKFLNGDLSYRKIVASFRSYLGHLSHTNSEGVKRNLKEKYFKVIAKKAVQREGNWNNGANAGPFCANLNNAPSNVNNNIGFRCCSVHEAKVFSLRRNITSHVQMRLLSLAIFYILLMKTGAKILRFNHCSFRDEIELRKMEVYGKT